MLECEVHPGKPIALQMFDRNQNEDVGGNKKKFSYRCTENVNDWCGCYVTKNDKFPPLKFFSDVTVQSPYKSPISNDFDLGSSFFNPGYGTSTPFVGATKNLKSSVGTPDAKAISKFLANFEENSSRLSDTDDRNHFPLSSDNSSIGEQKSASVDQSCLVEDSQHKEEISSKSRNLAKESRSIEQSQSLAIVDESPSQRGDRDFPQKPMVEKYRRIRLESSSSDDGSNIIRPSTLVNKNLPKFDTFGSSVSKAYVSPFRKPNRIQLEVSSDYEEENEQVKNLTDENNKNISNVPFKLVEKSDINLESSDSSVVEIPPLSDNSISIKTDVEDISSKLQGVRVKNISTVDSQSLKNDSTNQEKLRETLKSSLKNLQAALPKAASLPDKGARLKAKISDIEAQLQKLDNELKNSVKPYAAIFESDAEAHRQQQLYAINENDRHKLYGGRMNDARRIEVKVITQEAVKTLHTAMTQRPTECDEIDQPPGLRIELMPHQKQAIKWLTWRESQQPPGGVLADDMGLGKTLTMIALVLFQRSNDKETKENKCDHFFGDKLRKSLATLVICPASLIYQWQGEIERRVKPGFLNCLVYHGPKRETSASRMASYDFVITSYETVSSEVGSGEDDDKKTKKKKPAGASVLLSIAWERIILDEGHRIKNFKAGISKACCRLPASNRWVLTGTPIHNKLTDFYSLLKFLRFEPFDEFQVWRRWIENKSEQGKRRLDAIIKGILLRRTKDQISSVTGKAIVDLPPRKSEVHQVDLSPLEKKIYDRIFMASKKQVADFIKQQAEKDYEMTAISSGRATQKEFGYRNPFQPKQVSKNGNCNTKSAEFFTRSHILVLLLRLRQACSHFALMKEAIDVTAFDDLEPEDDVTADNLIQQFTDMTILDGPDSKTDDDSNKIAGLFNHDFVSTKINVLMQRLDQILDSHTSERKEKALIISQWAKLLDIVEFHLKKKGTRYTSITGKTPPEERNVRMEKFNAKNTGPVVMLLSLTAGGVGLNLVGANHLFLIDLHWNPALENQACDRIYRLGQERNVFVHKFVCKNTIEEKVFEIQQRKVGLAQSVLEGSSNRTVNALSLNDIKYLFEL